VEVVGFRAWCRAVVERPEVRAALERYALENPEFALRLAEHGFGRPPQALDVRQCAIDDGRPIEYVVRLDDPEAHARGEAQRAVPVAALGLPVKAAAGG
jgi:hypothetical protein